MTEDVFVIPASFAQQRLWFLTQLNRDTAAYNMPAAFKIRGQLDRVALEKSLNEIVRRHEILRTTFEDDNGEPMQIIAPSLTLRLLLLDLCAVGTTEQEAQVRRLTREEAQKPFNLAEGPLLRAKLLRLKDEEHILLFTMHHIVADGWSIGVLIREMVTLYEAFSKGEPSPLPELAIQYADYSLWQREWLRGDLLQNQLAYWKGQLEGDLPPLDLPISKPRPRVLSDHGSSQPFTLSKSLSDKLHQLSHDKGATLFMTLLAAFKILLHKYSHQNSIIVGSPIANRNSPEIEDLIGFCINTLALRTDLSGDPSFIELLGRVRETALAAYSHQDIPFEMLVDELRLERDLNRTPLFQVMFVLQNAPREALQAPGLSFSLADVEVETAKFDLTLTIEQPQGELSGSLSYKTDLFDVTAIKLMLRHFENLLESIVADPNRRVSELSYMTDAERRQLLFGWNDTRAEYSIYDCLHRLFEQQVKETPDGVAVICDDQRLSYRELDERANQLCRHLQGLGVGPEVPVGIFMEKSLEAITGILGVLKTGGYYVPIDQGLPKERLAFILKDTQMPVLLTVEGLLESLPEHVCKVVCLDRDWDEIATESRKNPENNVRPENLVYVIYTSGSTGIAKGVAVEHRQLVNYVRAIVERLGITGGQSFATVSTIAADLGNTAIYPTLCTGGTLHLVSKERAVDTKGLAEYFFDHRVGALKIVPSHLAALMTPPDSERTLPQDVLVLGGEPLGWSLVRKVQAVAPELELFNHYGPTETTVGVTTYRIDLNGGDDISATVPIGRPLSNTQIYLLDENGGPVPVGISGELYIAGAGLARCYLNRPDSTAEKFIPDPFSEEAGARLYRTGDLARYLADGNIEFLGRIDDQVKLRGFRIELGEIEAVLGQHPAVRECVVLVREEASGKGLVGYVVGGEVSGQELREYLRQRVPEYMVPGAIVLMEALPLTPNGKIDRKALPAPQFGSDTATAVTPATPVEEVLVSIWCQVLDVSEVGVNENFFELGGHSLLVTQVMSRVREAFAVEVGVREMFERPTIRRLGELIERERRASGAAQLESIRVAERSEALALSSAQQRLWFLDQLEPDSPFYNIPAAIRLTGRLDVTALENGLNEIVRRHESLRTTFEIVDGRPSQKVAPSLNIHFDSLDLAGLPETAREVEVERQVNEEAQRPFNLVHGPLLRAKLLRLDEEEHIALITMHHIISDGWSMGVLIREIAPLYDAYRQDQTALLPELPIQYADYAVWQEGWLKSEECAAQISYWKQQLAGAERVLELPTDKPRPAVQTYRGARQELVLPEGLSESVKKLGREEGVTLFMTLLGAFKVMLSKYTRQQDISVGVPIAGRNKIEIENLIGCFMNTLVMRSDLSGDPTFRELLSRVREVTLGAYDHQDLPFEKLVEEIQPQRDLSHSPLFQVMFALNNTRRGVLELEDVKFDALIADSGTAKFDLVLWMDNTSQTLKGTLEYNTDLFEHSTITRMLGHYTNLLESVVADPNQQLSNLRMLTGAEQQRLLVDWNDTRVDYLEGTCIHQLIETQAEKTPDAIAIVFEGEELTYSQLNAKADRLAGHLRSVGVEAEIRVGICAERSIEMVVGLLGILKAGGAYVPIDPAYPKERIAFVLDDAQVRVLLTQKHLTDDLPPHSAFVVLLDEETGWQQSEAGPIGQVAPGNLAYVIYTSGSTGKPKGVMVTHENVVNFFTAMDQRIGGDRPGTWLALTSISFDISILELFWTLARGFKVVVQREQGANLVASRSGHAASAKRMDFSLFYFASDDDEGTEDKYRLLIEGAKFADRHGFTAIWTPERHFHAFGGMYPNPSVTSAAIATVTEQLQIRAGSVVLPLQSPIRVAEEWAVVDNLSRGRVAISFASGWHANDFVLAPDNYAQRKEIMMRDIETVRKLWRGESVRGRGGAGSEVEVSVRPRPVQKELPIWLTAAGNPDTFRSAGEIGAGVLTHLLGQSIESLEEKIAIYRESWRKHNPGLGDGHVTLMIHTFVGEDRDVVREKVRTPFSNYLKSSVDLIKNTARSIGKDVNSEDYDEEDMKAVLAHAFDRYFETSGLFGTPSDCLGMVEKLKSAGVDEVACLVDFGVDAESVLSGLRSLDMVRRRSKKLEKTTAGDFSIPAQITRHQVTHLQCTPSVAQMLQSDPESRIALRSLTKLMVGGEALPVALANQLRSDLPADIINMYGPTETTIWSSTFAVDEPASKVPVGRPVANTSMFILDEQLKPVPVGVPGNLYIGGQGVTRGYLNRPELTAERFIPDPFGWLVGARLYETGDRARYLEEGDIEFLGRDDYQVKIDGHRIELGEIEAVLARLEGVRETVVVAREDGGRGKRLVAYVVAEQRVQSEMPRMPSPAERERLLAHHRSFKLPNGLVIAHLSDFQTNVGYREVFEDEVYLRNGISLKEGDCVFDVGANAGFFTLFANQKCKDLRMFAFEPIPATFEVLQTNVALYGLNAKLYECGLSNKAGTSEFTFYPDMAGLSGRYADADRDKNATKAIIQDWLKTNADDNAKAVLTPEEVDQVLGERFRSEKCTCRLRTLSEIIRENDVERIDLLKIDVERSEYDVLCGIEDEDWKKIDQIVMEVDTKENLDRITSLLGRHGYEVNVDDFVNVQAAEAEDPDVDIFMLYATQKSAARQQPSENGSAKTAQLAVAEGIELSISELRGFMKKRLPEYMIPSSFVFLDALPLTPNGKVDRKALPEPGTSRPDLETAYVAPETGTEQTIAAIWQEVLGVERLGAHDNFFEVGGTSLLLVQVNSKLRESFKISIPMVEMFRHPTVSSMARHLTQGRTEAPSMQRVQDRANKQAEAINLQKQFRKAWQGAGN